MKKFWKTLVWVAGSLLGLLLAVLVAVQIVLSPKVCATLVGKYYPEFIDGELSMSRAYVSVFRHFPAVTVNIDSLAITYPAERYDSLRTGIDTLASFDRFTAAVNVLPLIHGTINLKTLELMRMRAFLRLYPGGVSNLSVIKPLAEDEDSLDTDTDDSSSVNISDIVLRKVHIADARVFCYNQGDTLHFDLDHFKIRGRRGRARIDAQAVAYAATHAFGNINVPFLIDGRIAYGHGDGFWRFSCKDLDVSVATVEAVANMDVDLGERIGLRGDVAVKDIDVNRLLTDYASHFYADALKFKTNAQVSAGVSVDGYYDGSTGELPAFDATVDIPRFDFEYSDLPVPLDLELHVKASACQSGPVRAEISGLSVDGDGLSVKLAASADDVLGDKLAADVDGSLAASLGELSRYLSQSLGMDLSGDVSGEVKGHLDLSDLGGYAFNDSDLKAHLDVSDVTARSFDDSLNVYLDRMNVKVALMEDRFKMSPDKKAKTLGASVKIDSVYFCSVGNMNVNGKKLTLLAQSSPVAMKLSDGQSVNPLFAMLSVGGLYFEGQDSLSVRLKDSRNRVKIVPSRDGTSAPTLGISSSNSRARIKMGAHRFFFRDLSLSADARMSGNRLRQDKRVSRYMDSIYRAHPSWTRDSVRNYIRSRARMRQTPKWMSEEDFRKSDISFDLGETFRKYFTDWDLSGKLHLARAGVASPAFPLRTAITGFQGSFDNDRISLDTLRVVAGSSNLSADGSVTNLRRVIMRRGMIKLNLKINTDSLAVGELLNAYAMGQKNLETDLAYLASVDDETYEKTVASEQLADSLSATSGLIVVPANVDAHLALRGKGVTYSSLKIHRMKADAVMKERCLQLVDFSALTSAGNLSLNAFYSTQTKKELYTGFDLSLKDVSAAQVIDLMPQVDTLIPLLKSFDGMLNCNLSATVQLDTNMNLLTPTMNGVMRITGEDLHFNDNPQIEKIGRMLLFKKPKRATIDTMRVEGIIKDNMLEIFPFLLKMDRWTLALAGIQNMDKSFQYHVSLAKTPLLLHLGANITGPDFDHMSFKLGKAKYRNTKIPSFSTAIDTARVNLLSSIRTVFTRGVRQAVSDNKERQAAFMKERAKHKYERSAALDTIEPLSAAEQKQIDSLSVTEQQQADSLSVAERQQADTRSVAPDTLRNHE